MKLGRLISSHVPAIAAVVVVGAALDVSDRTPGLTRGQTEVQVSTTNRGSADTRPKRPILAAWLDRVTDAARSLSCPAPGLAECGLVVRAWAPAPQRHFRPAPGPHVAPPAMSSGELHLIDLPPPAA